MFQIMEFPVSFLKNGSVLLTPGHADCWPLTAHFGSVQYGLQQYALTRFVFLIYVMCYVS